MTCPGGFVLTMLLSLWFVNAIVRAARRGVRRALREMSTVEFYSLCWLVCTLLVLVVVPYKPARRFAMLAIPLALLAVSFAARTLGRRAAATEPSSQPAVMGLDGHWRIVLGIATVAVWCRYAYKTLALVRQDWFCLDPTTVPRSAWVLAAAACLAVGVLFFVLRRPQGTVKVLLAAFFIVSVTLDGIWYAHASYTIRDLSKARPGQPARPVHQRPVGLCAVPGEPADAHPLHVAWRGHEQVVCRPQRQAGVHGLRPRLLGGAALRKGRPVSVQHRTFSAAARQTGRSGPTLSRDFLGSVLPSAGAGICDPSLALAVAG